MWIARWLGAWRVWVGVGRVVADRVVVADLWRRLTHRHQSSARLRHARSVATCPHPARPAESGIILWHCRDVSADSVIYNHPVLVDAFGDLDAAALRAAFATVAVRHEALRTVIDVADGVARPRVLTTVAPPIEWVDMTDMARMDGIDGQGMAHAVRSVVDRPFALPADQPPRVAVFRIDDAHHRVLLVTQRLSGTEWTAAPLLADLASAYAATAAPAAAVSWSSREAAR